MAKSKSQQFLDFCYRELKEVTSNFTVDQPGILLLNWSQMRSFGVASIDDFPRAARRVQSYIRRHWPAASGRVVIAFGDDEELGEQVISVVYYTQKAVDDGNVTFGEVFAVPRAMPLGDPGLN